MSVRIVRMNLDQILFVTTPRKSLGGISSKFQENSSMSIDLQLLQCGRATCALRPLVLVFSLCLPSEPPSILYL